MAKQTVSEEEIHLRKRARRRLVGAIALVILAAILLPMVFDDQVKPVGNVEIQIQDEKTAPPFESKIPPAASAPAASLPVAAESAPAAEKPPVAGKPAATEEKPAARNPVSGQEFVVQLGVFSNASNVRDLRSKLSAAGIETYIESNAAGAQTRVRAGPYPSRAAAENARRKILKSGLDGVVENR
ncbi:MAG: SPOR domain-containing protein [Burkholderiales bacterium]|nr:SPOR domain-containing protein [Burkholderiales bacterium]